VKLSRSVRHVQLQTGLIVPESRESHIAEQPFSAIR
jgi:hypothetical protein